MSSTGVTRASTSSAAGPPFSASFVRLFSIAAESPIGGAGKRVVERDAPTGSRDDLRDPAAHLAGADNQDVLELHGAE